MSVLAIAATAWAGLFALAWWLCRAGDEALVDVGPEAVPHCPACAVADDRTTVSLHLIWWDIECEAAS